MIRHYRLPVIAATMALMTQLPACSDRSDVHAWADTAYERVGSQSSALDRNTLAQRFAPLVKLHPQDRFRPANATSYYASATPTNDAQLVVPQTWWNTRGESVDDGSSHAPAYFKYAQYQGRSFLQYWFFYGTNGCQGFTASTGTPLTPGSRNFDWCSFAYHEADWEHITVRLAPDEGSIERVHYAAHGNLGRWYGPEEMSFAGSHPVVFSALNSHASYPSDQPPFDIVVSETLPISLPVVVRGLKTADLVSKNVKLDTYEQQPFSDYVRWNTWEQMIDIDDWSSPSWAWYWGAWGQMRTNSAGSAPGSLPGDVRALLAAGASIASAVGSLDAYRVGDPPWGPRYQTPWEEYDSPPPVIEACFTTEVGFAGDRVCFGEGDVSYVGDTWNDRLSSLRIYGGATVDVFRDGNFGGSWQSLTNDVGDLSSLGMNDVISAVRVKPPTTQACFYTDNDYLGMRVCISTGDLTGLAWDHNDQFSSVRLYGTAVDVYEHAGFEGQSRHLTGDVPSLGDLGFNDVISSMRVRAAPRVCLYTNARFTGNQVCYSGDVRAVPSELNDSFDSVQLLGGAVIQLYADNDFGGDTRYLTEDAVDLVAKGFGDRTSSFKIWW